MANKMSYLSKSLDSKNIFNDEWLIKFISGDSTEKANKVLQINKFCGGKIRKMKRNRQGNSKKMAYANSGAKKSKVPYESLKPKVRCLECNREYLYELPNNLVIVQ